MKYITCFILAIIFYFAGICDSAASPGCDPSKPCISQTNDTTAAKKAAVKINTPSNPPQTVNKPTAKKEEKKANCDFVSPLSWRPTLLY